MIMLVEAMLYKWTMYSSLWLYITDTGESRFMESFEYYLPWINYALGLHWLETVRSVITVHLELIIGYSASFLSP